MVEHLLHGECASFAQTNVDAIEFDPQQLLDVGNRRLLAGQPHRRRLEGLEAGKTELLLFGIAHHHQRRGRRRNANIERALHVVVLQPIDDGVLWRPTDHLLVFMHTKLPVEILGAGVMMVVAAATTRPLAHRLVAPVLVRQRNAMRGLVAAAAATQRSVQIHTVVIVFVTDVVHPLLMVVVVVDDRRLATSRRGHHVARVGDHQGRCGR